jgi:hypothetical protein
LGRWWIGIGQLGEEIAEAIEATLPSGAALGDPVFGGAQRVGSEAEGADAADLLGVDDAAGLEHLEVLDDSGEGHGQRRGELGDGRWAATEAIDERATGGIGESLEDAIEGWRVGGHSHHLSTSYSKESA